MGEAWKDALGIGLQSHDVGVGQMALRAIVIYVATLAIVRAGKKRFLGRASAFDTIVGIVIGSIVSRAITGSAPMLPALAASATIIALHWLLSWLAMQWKPLGTLIKGEPILLVQDGVPDRARLRAEHMTDRDLAEDLRGHGLADCSGIGEARLERNGRLSVIKRGEAPKVVEIKVEAGVQIVRVELG